MFSQGCISFTIWAHVIFFLSLMLWKENNQWHHPEKDFHISQSNKSRIINHVLLACELDLSGFSLRTLSVSQPKENPVGTETIVH